MEASTPYMSEIFIRDYNYLKSKIPMPSPDIPQAAIQTMPFHRREPK
jgi:hypothetical protein